jgi:hypothetical protein
LLAKFNKIDGGLPIRRDQSFPFFPLFQPLTSGPLRW